MMGVFDITVLVCLVAALCIGLKKGFISQVMSLVALCLGIWLSVKLSPAVGTWLKGWLSIDDTALRVIAFVLIFCVVTLGLTLVGKVLETVVKVVLLGWLNRLLGALLAVFECLLILCLLLMAFDALNGVFEFAGEDSLAGTAFYGPLKTMAYALFPYLKELLFWN